ncbi:HNH endonuclease [Ruania halotolerans]|uniref:HNH endonuclease n=1 Tax=Ruania halotolerans TaxID=2897773 RepID=UPI001E320678|nr:HNH endonuclease signature motif containing protein [Ruania halotolerans]UFU06717.1 DUF222 domain-containing protein [Ruania halotolerans]
MSTMTSTGPATTAAAEAVLALVRERFTESDVPGKLAVVNALLDDVLGADLHSLPSVVLPELVHGLEQARRRLDALTTTTITAVEADGGWAVSGARTMASWWTNATGTHGGKARTQVRLARTVRDHLPATATALAAGGISGDHAAALARHATTTPALQERLTDPELGESFLLGHARALDADSFTRLIRTWAIRADPESADRNWRDDAGKEHLFVSATTGGHRVDGWLDDTNGQIVARAFDAVTGVPAADDDRTPSQRNAHALVTIARHVLDSGDFQPSGRIRPHLLVHVPAQTLHRLTTTPEQPEGSGPNRRPRCTCHHQPTSRGPSAAISENNHGPTRTNVGNGARASSSDPADEPGRLGSAPTLPGLANAHVLATVNAHASGCPADPAAPMISASIDHEHMNGAEPATLADGTPISHAQLAQLACEGEFTRIIFGPHSEILDVGRAARLHTRAQTTAIWARDRHCQYPGCTTPPGWGEIHHTTWWSRGGSTTANQGILLCWHHHHVVHQRDITITRHTDHWHFTRPGGHPLTYHHPPPCERPVLPRE